MRCSRSEYAIYLSNLRMALRCWPVYECSFSAISSGYRWLLFLRRRRLRRAKVYHPVGVGYHIAVVLYHNHCIPGGYQAVKDLQELIDIVGEAVVVVKMYMVCDVEV